MILAVFLIVSGVILFIYVRRKKTESIKQKPDHVISEYEAAAFRRITWIKQYGKEGTSRAFRPMPDVLMKIERLQSWYNRISEIDKHNKEEALKDAEDWKDVADYIHDMHFFYVKCNADIDDDDIEQAQRSGIKLSEIEKRWAAKLGFPNLEKVWNTESVAKNKFLKNSIKETMG